MIGKYLSKVLNTPPRELIPKVRRKVRDKLNDRHVRRTYLFNDARLNLRIPEITSSYVHINELDLSGLDHKISNYLAEMYLDHRFDLLGSGWVKNTYFSKCLGLEGTVYQEEKSFTITNDGEWLNYILAPQHVEKGKRLYRQITPGYTPIDWQRDYKSGFRWDQKKWHGEQRVMTKPGGDIKVPWELSRFQHLPQLAVFAKHNPERRKEIILEFKNQTLDFIAANPPFMGACWVCAMDVGIGAANLLLAYDIFTQLDEEGVLDHSFRQVFAESIYERGKFILYNLEFSEKLTSNHYLSDITGLLFIASYLQENKEVSSWLAFSVQEFFSEFEKQFNKDGTNFEASTSYHRLSSELITYSVALILGLPKEKLMGMSNRGHVAWPYQVRLKDNVAPETGSPELAFPKAFIETLQKIGLFTLDITKPTGEIPQIGDNDSGRFLRFSPNGIFLSNSTAEETYLNLKGYSSVAGVHKSSHFWDENILNHATLLSAISGLFKSTPFDHSASQFPLEFSLIKSMSRGKMFEAVIEPKQTMLRPSGAMNLPYAKETIIRVIKPGVDLLRGLKAHAYENSGFYILKSQFLFLMISAGPNGQRDHGGHAHNDKLSIELNIDGLDIIVDPGTYLYTPLPDWRIRFRSVSAHPTLQTGSEQNHWTDDAAGLFSLKNESRCAVLCVQPERISAKLTYRNITQIRTVDVLYDRIIIADQSTVPFENKMHPFKWYSSGYGKIQIFEPDLTGFTIEYSQDQK